MNYIIDIIILLCLGWGAYKGFRKGFIIQSFVVLSLILAVWGGFALSGLIEPFMAKHFHMSETTCSIVSFVVVFLLVLIAVYASGYLVTKAINAMALGLINRLAGAVFGILANVLVLSIVIILFNKINDKKDFVSKEKLRQSYLYGPVGKAAPAIFPEKFFKKILS